MTVEGYEKISQGEIHDVKEMEKRKTMESLGIYGSID